MILGLVLLLAVQATRADTIVARQQWAIGDATGEEWEIFGQVSAVVGDLEGRVLVADGQQELIRAYDSRGNPLGKFGRKGDGPGEFVGLSCILLGPAGLVLARDSRRVTSLRFTFTPFRVAVQDSWSGPVYPSSRLPSRLDQEGRYYYPYSRSLQRSGAPPQHFYLVYDQGKVVDTLPVPRLSSIRTTDPAWIRTGLSGGRVLTGLSHVPFAPTPAWDVLPDGRLVSTDGASESLSISNRAGENVGSILVRRGSQRSVPRQEQRDSLRALEARLDSIPVPLAEVLGMPVEVQRRQLPSVLPEATGLHVDTAGRIWVRRWPDAGSMDMTVFDVFNQRGQRLATVRLPVELESSVSPWIGPDIIVGVVRHALYGFDRVVVFSYAM